MKKTQLGRACLLLCASLASGCGAGQGQTNGEIRGNVNDPSGAVVPGAHVTAMLAGTDTMRTATAGKDGDLKSLNCRSGPIRSARRHRVSRNS